MFDRLHRFAGTAPRAHSLDLHCLPLFQIVVSLFVVLLGAPCKSQGWVEIPGSNSPATYGSQAVYDEARQNMVLAALGFPTCTFDGTTFSTGSILLPPQASGFTDHSRLVFDPRTQTVVTLTSTLSAASCIYHLAAWDGTAWTYRPLPSLDLPSATSLLDYQLCWDATQQRLLALGYNPNTGSHSSAYIDTVPSVPVVTMLPSVLPRGGLWQLFSDSVTQRPIALTTESQVSGLVTVRAYRWTGVQWTQQFPSWPFSLNDNFQGQIATDFVSTTLASGALAFRYMLNQNGGIVPRTVRLAGGVASELFLTSYPPEDYFYFAWNPGSSCFYAFGRPGTNVWRLDLGPDAQASTIGAGCIGSRGIPSLAPQQGSTPRIGTTFVLQSLNLPLSGPVFLALGASDTLYGPTPLPLNLAPLGAPQCNLLVSIDNMFPSTNILGAATWGFTIPNIPGGVFFTQAVVFDPAANAFGITLSNAVRGVIGS